VLLAAESLPGCLKLKGPCLLFLFLLLSVIILNILLLVLVLVLVLVADFNQLSITPGRR